MASLRDRLIQARRVPQPLLVTFPSHISREQALVDLWYGMHTMMVDAPHHVSLEDASEQFRQNGPYVYSFKGKDLMVHFGRYPVVDLRQYSRYVTPDAIDKIFRGYRSPDVELRRTEDGTWIPISDEGIDEYAEGIEEMVQDLRYFNAFGRRQRIERAGLALILEESPVPFRELLVEEDEVSIPRQDVTNFIHTQLILFPV